MSSDSYINSQSFMFQMIYNPYVFASDYTSLEISCKQSWDYKGYKQAVQRKNIQMKTCWTLPLIEDVQIKDNFIW